MEAAAGLTRPTWPARAGDGTGTNPDGVPMGTVFRLRADFDISTYAPSTQVVLRALQKHGAAVFGEPIPTSGTPLYTDVRLYGEHGIPAAIYGAGPRTVLESNAKRADEHLVLEDLKRATKVVARTLFELLQPRTHQMGA